MPADWSYKPTLAGAHVLLRPFEEEDLAALGVVLADPEVLRLTGSVHSSAEALGRSATLDARAVAWYRSRNDASDRIDLMIVDRARGACVGEAVLNELREADGCCNFRILIGPSGRDRGFGTEATRLLVAYAFDSLDLHRVELEVYASNPRAIRAYEKAGFVVEGVRRDALRFDDRWIDALMMSRLATDPVT